METINTTNTIIPPNSLETEKALLGSIILLQSVPKEVELMVKPGFFFNELNQQIFAKMLKMTEHLEPIDLLTLRKNIPTVDMAYLASTVNLVPSSSNSLHYAKIIRDKYILRQIIQISEKMSETALSESINIYDMLERTKSAIDRITNVAENGDKTEEEKRLIKLKSSLANYDGEDKVVSFATVCDSLKEGDSIPRYHTGWLELDKIISGFKPKHLIAIGGVMKHGKTSFTMDMVTKMSKYNPLYLALEEPIEELIEKFVERGENPPHGFTPRYSSVSKTDWVEKKIIEGIEKYDSKIVFVDNLNWLKPTDSEDITSKPEKYERIMQELKTIAKRLNVCVVIIIHLNKNAKGDTMPTYDDIMGSATIGQLVDKAIFVWRETKSGKNGQREITNNTNISVQLNRQGGVGDIPMKYENGHFIEYDWHKKDDELDEFDSVKKENSKILNNKQIF